MLLRKAAKAKKKRKMRKKKRPSAAVRCVVAAGVACGRYRSSALSPLRGSAQKKALLGKTQKRKACFCAKPQKRRRREKRRKKRPSAAVRCVVAAGVGRAVGIALLRCRRSAAPRRRRRFWERPKSERHAFAQSRKSEEEEKREERSGLRPQYDAWLQLVWRAVGIALLRCRRSAAPRRRRRFWERPKSERHAFAQSRKSEEEEKREERSGLIAAVRCVVDEVGNRGQVEDCVFRWLGSDRPVVL